MQKFVQIILRFKLRIDAISVLPLFKAGRVAGGLKPQTALPCKFQDTSGIHPQFEMQWNLLAPIGCQYVQKALISSPRGLPH